MQRRRIGIDDIYIGPRHRNPDAAKVKEIAKSISEIGLMNPPAVCFRDGIEIDGCVVNAVPVLIYGRHRLLALQENGEEVVECLVYDVDDLRAELMEIDENLARAELGPAQEAAHIARRKAIWEEMRGGDQSGQFVPIESKREDGRGHRAKQFAAELAAIIPSDGTAESAKRDINRKIARAEVLKEDIHRIPGTSLDKGVELDALIKLPEQERKELIERAAKGETVSARAVPADKALGVMMKASRASECAEWLRTVLAEDHMPTLLSYLDEVSSRDIAAALRRAA